MDKQVIFRDRQELQADDLNNLEAFADRAFGHVISDAITGERQIVGLTISEATTTSIEVAEGRLWSGDTGEIFALDAAQTISVFSYLPVSDYRWLAVSVAGSETETDTEPRDFLIDLQTGETEPQTVAMEQRRAAVAYITSGVESTDPQKPATPTGHTLIGHVKLDVSGITDIEQATNKALPNLNALNTRVVTVEAWKQLAEPRISTLASDVSELARRLGGIAQAEQVRGVALDVARLKEVANLPDTFSAYAADHFLDADESDTENVDWYARVDEGIRFPWAGQTEQQLALFNPLTHAVISHSGFLLPAYDPVVRLETTGYAGELSISQYQSQSHTFKQGITSRQRWRYGPTRDVCTNSRWWQTGSYDPATRIFQKDGESFQVFDSPTGFAYRRLVQFWVDSYNEPYWFVETANTNISGAQVAQTFLQAQNGWLTKIDLSFTRTAESGVVYLHLCETDRGIPNLERVIGSTSANAANLQDYPTVTPFSFSKPVYLAAGKRYALVLTTTGDHYLAVVSGTEYTQGTLFYGMDGAYYQGDFTKDLMMRFHYAAFRNPRTQVELSPISLANGIADLDLLAEMIVPESTELVLEYQKDGSGTWYPVSAATPAQLVGLPAMLNLRAVFVGSTDLMPGIGLTGSRLQANRPALTFTHISAERTLGAASDDIEVQVLLEGFDDGHHTLTCSLTDNGTDYTADTTTDRVEGDGLRRTFAFSPEDGIGLTTYQIVIEGTTDNALIPFHVAERVDIALTDLGS